MIRGAPTLLKERSKLFILLCLLEALGEAAHSILFLAVFGACLIEVARDILVERLVAMRQQELSSVH